MDLWDDLPVAAELTADRPRRAAHVLCDALKGMPFTGDPSLVPIRPVVLAEAVRASVNTAALRLFALIRRVCWSLTDDPADLARRTGLGEQDVPLLGAGGVVHEIEYAACNGRSDVVLRDGTPMFLECNFGAANGDPVSAHPLFAVYGELYGLRPSPRPDESPEPFHGRLDFYRRICAAQGLPESVAIVGTMREPDIEDVRYFDAEAAFLREHGFDSSFVEPETFASRRRRYSIALKHFLSGGWRTMGVPLDGIARAHADTIFLVSDSGLSLSSKLIFAWLSAEFLPLSAEDRHFVRTHIPWTRLVEHGPVLHQDKEHNLLDLAVERREHFVLKPLNSCAGRGVLIGRSTDPGEWAGRLETAALRRDHVLQQYVDADPLHMDFFDQGTGVVKRIPVAYTLGPYVVDGVNSGLSIRHAPGPGAKVVNHAQGASFNVVL
ncbi:MAG: hypothetical protein ACRDQ2_00185 [Gaiellales bacterium]